MAEVGNPDVPLRTITRLMGLHYQQSLLEGGNNPERVLRLFTDRVVADLKALDPKPPIADENAAIHGYSDAYASPND